MSQEAEVRNQEAEVAELSRLEERDRRQKSFVRRHKS
jgi:hypothetical protein